MSTWVDTGTDQLLCTIDEGVATVTLNRPDRKNALSDYLTPALRQILFDLDTMPGIGCVVITGAGNAFCAGGDISGMNRRNASPDQAKADTQDKIKSLQHKQEALTLRLWEHSKPTIAVLPGAAAGAGMSIALACDIRIAADTAFITSAFRTIGFSGDYGGSWFLTQLVGPARAKEIYFTARRVSAEECLQLGIVNHLVPADQLQQFARDMAHEIATGPPIAIRYMKENINRAVTQDLKTCLAMEADRMIRSGQTEDHREAVKAFMEKRKPTFSGR